MKRDTKLETGEKLPESNQNQITEPRRATRKLVDVRGGIAFSLAFFVIAIILYFQPRYFGSATQWVSVVCVIIGLMALGTDLDRLTEELLSGSIRPKNGKDVFNNIGIGAGVLLLWAIIYTNTTSLLINILIFIVLFFGVSGTLWGIMNFIFDMALSRKNLEEQRIKIEADPEKKDALIDLNNSRYYTSLKNIVLFIGFLVGLLSGIATVLQWLKIGP